MARSWGPFSAPTPPDTPPSGCRREQLMDWLILALNSQLAVHFKAHSATVRPISLLMA